MKFRAKFNTPWCKRGEIFKLDNYPEQEKSICYEYKSRAILFDPMAYPDLFEPVEEKSNYEKWSEILRPYIKKITSAAVESWKRMPSKFYEEALDIEIRSLNIFLSERLDADKICKEVCGEG